MSKLGRIIGLVAALAMFVFSAVRFVNTADWVAAVFAVGSLGYFLFFLVVYRGKDL